ncbi:hypothetical protein Pmani_021638 [Petrolisthes manimaculis]|uniref:Uncharacterized protein n=1 Tax=Petrolisthes manimaculis TaxID=1843537 RepID=A0AAE1U538_9EUCA|nr:hypothetical protein Pmani_021638 [Petrolisthes manimaculis]
MRAEINEAKHKKKEEEQVLKQIVNQQREEAKRLKIECIACRKEERAQRKILRELEKVEIKRKKTIITRAQKDVARLQKYGSTGTGGTSSSGRGTREETPNQCQGHQ